MQSTLKSSISQLNTFKSSPFFISAGVCTHNMNQTFNDSLMFYFTN